MGRREERLCTKGRRINWRLIQKGKKSQKNPDYLKKRSFSTRFSINVFYSSISLSFPQLRGLCSARKNVLPVSPFLSALCISYVARWCVFFFTFKQQWIWPWLHWILLKRTNIQNMMCYVCNVIVRPPFPYCNEPFGLNMQNCLTWNQTDIELTLKPLDGTSNVIQCGDIIVVISSILEILQVMHENCSQAFYIRASSGRQYTSRPNA